MKINEKELLSLYFDEAKEKLKEIIAIPSYAQEPKGEEKPYGQGVYDVLNYAINLASEMGFETYKDYKNRYGYLDFGTGNELFVILCHLDVVPPGNIEKWTTPPFSPIEVNNTIIGRGSFDDKGPTIINLYALKYLKDHGFNPDYKIRLIFGLTEETTWNSIHAYIADHGTDNVVMGYTPDGDFPVVYAEKWVVDLDLTSREKLNYSIKGGDAYNVVADMVKYRGPKVKELAKYLEDNNVETKIINNDELYVQGKAGHGSLPWLGINAATWLASAMKANGFNEKIINFLALIHEDFYGRNLISSIADETGDLTINLGIINIHETHQKLGFNFRIPTFATVEDDFLIPFKIVAKDYNFNVENIKTEDHVYVPKDSDLIKKIMHVYQEVTNDLESKPLAIGGGTYAKAMPNVVAFGAEFDNEHSTMHAYNEFVNVDDLKKMLLIYTKALVLLTKK